VPSERWGQEGKVRTNTQNQWQQRTKAECHDTGGTHRAGVRTCRDHTGCHRSATGSAVQHCSLDTEQPAAEPLFRKSTRRQLCIVSKTTLPPWTEADQDDKKGGGRKREGGGGGRKREGGRTVEGGRRSKQRDHAIGQKALCRKEAPRICRWRAPRDHPFPSQEQERQSQCKDATKWAPGQTRRCCAGGAGGGSGDNVRAMSRPMAVPYVSTQRLDRSGSLGRPMAKALVE
jgi:hypothetical protein